MNLGDTTKPLGDGIFGRRFYLVGYLPIYAAALFLLLIIWAGARGWHAPAQHQIDFGRAWSKAASLSLGQALVLLVGVTLAAVLLQPLQLWLLRLLEGDWPPHSMAPGHAPGSADARRACAKRRTWARRARSSPQ